MKIPSGDHPINRSTLPMILVRPRQLSQLIEEGWDAIHAANSPPTLFRRGNRIARISDGVPVTLADVGQDVIYGVLVRSANWATPTKNGPEATKPPRELAADMVVNPSQRLPELSAVVSVPVLLPDGTGLLLRPGYDPASQLYYAPANNFAVAPISRRPSRTEVAAATDLLTEELLGDFPLATPGDRAAALAFLLTPMVRHYINGPTPIFLIAAPSPGSGKGLLADVVALITIGQPCPVTTVSSDESETRKKITALLIRSSPLILLDNLRVLDSPQIAAAITANIWSDRLLGKSVQLDLPNVSTWAMTANGPALTLELARRSVRISLEPGVERPWERKDFRHADLRAWAIKNRGQLVRAALTIIQHWIARGRPVGLAVLGSFEDWARTLGGILHAAGVPGFLADRKAFFEAVDDESVEWRGFVAAWWKSLGETKVSGGILLNLALETGTLASVIGDGSTPSRASRLGKALLANALRIVDGLQIRGELNPHSKTRVHWLHRVIP